MARSVVSAAGVLAQAVRANPATTTNVVTNLFIRRYPRCSLPLLWALRVAIGRACRIHHPAIENAPSTCPQAQSAGIRALFILHSQIFRGMPTFGVGNYIICTVGSEVKQCLLHSPGRCFRPQGRAGKEIREGPLCRPGLQDKSGSIRYSPSRR